VGALLIIVILTLMHGLDSRIRRRVLQMELYVEVDSKVSIGFVAKEIRKLGAKIEGIQIDRDYTFDGDIRALVLSIRTPKKAKHEELLAQLQEIEGIIYLEEL
jgi:uncharacterized membrane protein YhiD involved in acid resistance